MGTVAGDETQLKGQRDWKGSHLEAPTLNEA